MVFCYDNITLAYLQHCRQPFFKRTYTARSLLELLHLDVWGPAPKPSLSSFKFYLSIVDDFSIYTWLYPMYRKSDVITIFHNFKLLIENLLSSSIKIVRSDGSGEFANKQFQSLLHDSGITH